MYKKFDEWNSIKKITDSKLKTLFFHEREVWFVRIGENIGFEQNGKGDKFLRPVLIFKKFSSSVFFGIPLTSIQKNGKFYSSFNLKDQTSTAILSQLRLFDSKRLEYIYGKLNEVDFLRIKQKLIELIQ